MHNSTARANVNDVANVIDNYAYQPRDYRAALNRSRVQTRLSPKVLEQLAASYTNLQQQTTSAVELLTRREVADTKRLRQYNEIINKNPNSKQAAVDARRDVDYSALLADNVGISKSNTACLT